MARGRHSYKAPMAIASHYGLTRKEWSQLSKGEKMSRVRKYEWETSRDKMLAGIKKGHQSRKETRDTLLRIAPNR